MDTRAGNAEMAATESHRQSAMVVAVLRAGIVPSFRGRALTSSHVGRVVQPYNGRQVSPQEA